MAVGVYARGAMTGACEVGSGSGSELVPLPPQCSLAEAAETMVETLPSNADGGGGDASNELRRCASCPGGWYMDMDMGM